MSGHFLSYAGNKGVAKNGRLGMNPQLPFVNCILCLVAEAATWPLTHRNHSGIYAIPTPAHQRAAVEKPFPIGDKW